MKVEEQGTIKADQTLDCRGLTCATPIVDTAERIRQMKPGEILKIISDDPGIKLDISSWCEITGNKLVGLEETKGEIKLYVQSHP